MKVLGFWKKLFTACVSVVEFKTLSDKVETLNTEVNKKINEINDLSVSNVKIMKDNLNLITDVKNVNKEKNNLASIIEAKDTIIINLKKELDNLNCVPALVEDTSEVKTELKVTKEKLDLTLSLLENAELEIKALKATTSNAIVYECGCDDKEPDSKEEECLPIEDVVGDGTFEKEVVVTSADKLQNFVNGLSRVQMKELKDDILKGHKNDKRLTSTLKNWIKKFPDRLETQVYFMFKTALTRRRGKQQLGAWYSKFDDMK